MVFYVNYLHSGGEERAAINLSEALPLSGAPAGGVRTTLLVNQRGGTLASTVPDSVRVVSLEARRTIAALLPLVRFLRRERPDVIIPLGAFSIALAHWANRLSGRPAQIVPSLQVTVFGVRAHARGKSRLVPFLYRRMLPHVAHIVAASRGVADDAAARVPYLPPATVIHNPIVTPRLAEAAAQPLDHPWFAPGHPPLILAVGRLVEQKDLPLLIDAFAPLRRERPDARLAILGEGPLRQALLDKVAAMGLTEAVALLGTDPNPWRYMARASLMALSSAFEGFGNVLVEAMATGTPVVSTDHPHGPAEILAGGHWGALVPHGSSQALAQAMLRTLDDPLPADVLRSRAQQFTAAIAAESYHGLIRAACEDTYR